MRTISESLKYHKSMFSGKWEPNEDHFTVFWSSKEDLCNAELLYLFFKKWVQPKTTTTWIFSLSSFYASNQWPIWTENSIQVWPPIKKGHICPMRTEWGHCSIVGQNVVMMRTLVALYTVMAKRTHIVNFSHFRFRFSSLKSSNLGNQYAHLAYLM